MMKFVKSMNRTLTSLEREEVESYILEDPSRTIQMAVAYFESKFKMPVTERCIEGVVADLVIKGKL